MIPKPNTTLNVDTLGENNGFYSVLSDQQTITLVIQDVDITITRNDNNNQELYIVSPSEEVPGVSNQFKPGDKVIIRGRQLLFGSVLDLGNVLDPICLRKGSLVKTDQETRAIELIDSGLHTIRGKKIVAVTQTIYKDRFLVLIKKNALGKNKPDKDTVLTGCHKVLVNNKLINSFRLINNHNITKIRNHSELMYNVLLEEYTTMAVNNIEMETLDPDNKIAKLYQ